MNTYGRGANESSWLRPGTLCAVALAILLGAMPAAAFQDEGDEPTTPARQTADNRTPPSTDDAQPPQYQPLPSSLTLPAGTIITVRVSQLLSSDHNQVGDGFTAELQKPLVVEGWVVARRGQTVLGRVAVAQKAGRVKGTSQLGVELSNLVLVDGQQLRVRTQLQQVSAGTSYGRDAQAIGTTTGLGAIIGAAAGEGKGAGIGAGAGAAASIAGVLLTRGRPTVIEPETSLSFQLQSPLSFSTQRSRPAYRPVTQADYDNGTSLQRRPARIAVAMPYASPYWDYYPWGYYYPSPVFFGYYGFGGRFGRGHFRR